MQYKDRYFTPSSRSYFLFGPRGTGKSTWLARNYPQALNINLLQPDLFRQYVARPESLAETIKGSNATIIVLDEIQKAPELLNVVHSLIEEKRGWQFILTGSSSRTLKRKGVNLLAGRAIIRHMHPFMASELNSEFSLATALQYGMLPIMIDCSDPQDVLHAYVDLYLTEEVKAEALVRNIGNFTRFLQVMSFSHGTILNTSNIARECSISRKLVEGYLDVLQDLLLCYLLPTFTLRAKRKVTAHPKFYYFDTGVYRNLRSTGILDRTTEINGPGLEGLVLQHLRAWNDYQGTPNKLYYWRTKHGVEVDFIIYGSQQLYAIEVKHATTLQARDLTGLQTFVQDYPEAIPIMLYQGKHRLQKNNIYCLPIENFLQELHPNQPLLNF